MTVALWIFGGQIGIGAVAAALLGKPPHPSNTHPFRAYCPALILYIVFWVGGVHQMLVTADGRAN